MQNGENRDEFSALNLNLEAIEADSKLQSRCKVGPLTSDYGNFLSPPFHLCYYLLFLYVPSFLPQFVIAEAELMYRSSVMMAQQSRNIPWGVQPVRSYGASNFMGPHFER